MSAHETEPSLGLNSITYTIKFSLVQFWPRLNNIQLQNSSWGTSLEYCEPEDIPNSLQTAATLIWRPREFNNMDVNYSTLFWLQTKDWLQV